MCHRPKQRSLLTGLVCLPSSSRVPLLRRPSLFFTSFVLSALCLRVSSACLFFQSPHKLTSEAFVAHLDIEQWVHLSIWSHFCDSRSDCAPWWRGNPMARTLMARSSVADWDVHVHAISHWSGLLFRLGDTPSKSFQWASFFSSTGPIGHKLACGVPLGRASRRTRTEFL